MSIIAINKKEGNGRVKLQTTRLKKKDIIKFYRAAALKQIDVGRHVPVHEVVSDLTKHLEKLEYCKCDRRQKTNDS